MNELKFAFRQLLKNPGFTAVAVLTLALGIGACTAIFSLVHAVLLKPLPFHEPDRLVWIENIGAGSLSETTSRADVFREWREQSSSFEGLACYHAFHDQVRYTLSADGEPQRLRGVQVSQNFLDVLGVNVALGRNFSDEECVWNGPKAVILNHSFWRQKFAGDPAIVGQSVNVNGSPTRVVGILPRSFDFGSVFTPGNQVELLAPFPLVEQTARLGNTLFAIGRLKPGVTVAQSRADLGVINTRVRAANSDWDDFGARISTLDDHVRGAFRPAFAILSGAVACLLLIACVNLSNLLLARAHARRREFSVRIALGASRWRLVRQTLTESVLLSLGGSVVGVLTALLSSHAFARLQAFNIPFLHTTSIDPAALLFTVAVGSGAGVLCGVLPALQLWRRNSGAALAQTSARGSGGTSAALIRKTLVVSEVALACLLLGGAGLLIRSFVEVLNVDLGFRPGHVVAWRVDATRGFNSTEEKVQFYDRLAKRIAAVPGVKSAGLSDALPLGLGRNRDWAVGAKGVAYERGQFPFSFVRIVDHGYLQTLEVPLRAGRYFDDRDSADSGNTVIVSETMARSLWPGENPIGQTALVGGRKAQGHTVIGVVGDVTSNLEKAPPSEMYLSFHQTADWDSMELTVCSVRPSSAFIADVRAAIKEFDPTLPSNDFKTLDQIVDRAIAPRRLITGILGSFSSLALLLAAIGLYGVIAYSVGQRTHEMGIRLAVGAQRRDVLRLVLGEGLKVALTGVAIGIAAAFLVLRLLESQLYGVSSHDPLVFAANAVIVIGVTLLACWLPARRAARVDPMVALRSE